mmetsp:Transcript_137488/g.293842  ORF Transcript_137488/g.293842 Transcript_137488/m.293842 type:complete len:485 (-) Transcript_137488:188-1642(-)
MRAPRALRLAALWATLAAPRLAIVGAGADADALLAFRDYAPDAQSSTFYRPHEVQIEHVGLVNEGAAYFATRRGVSLLRDGLLTPVLEVVDADLTAFHLCHHRGSIFYEVLAREGGTLSIFEYSLAARQKVMVREFQDATAPATSLACVDQLLLRASPANLLALHLPSGAESVLRKFYDSASLDAFASLAVSYAADVITRSEVYAVVPQNHSLLRLRLTDEGGLVAIASTEPLLLGGDGSDGDLAAATAHQPLQVLWARGKVLFVDGCSLREIHDGQVRTLLGVPTECMETGNETLEPVSWTSRLSRPMALAASADGTAGLEVLLLTGAEVIRVAQHANVCTARLTDDSCLADPGCAWAEGPGPDHHLCFDCEGLERWANSLRQGVEACSLELAPRAGTRYSLTGCGCAPPPPAPEPAPGPDPQSDSEGAVTAGQVILVAFVIVAALIIAVLLYRASRRAAVMRELYGVDTAEFHTFTDEECLH